jgi:gas vesicle protein
MSDRDEFGAFLIGFVVGGLTGAITALLLAPQSGTETRALIKDKSFEFRDKAAESLEETYAQAEAAAVEARSRFDDLAKTTKDKAIELQQRGKILLEEQKTKISKAAIEEVDLPAESPAEKPEEA